MTGPEHYREAEKLAEIAVRQDIEQGRANVALAQVHATLALAAAYAEVNPTSMWHEVAGTKPVPAR